MTCLIKTESENGWVDYIGPFPAIDQADSYVDFLKQNTSDVRYSVHSLDAPRFIPQQVHADSLGKMNAPTHKGLEFVNALVDALRPVNPPAARAIAIRRDDIARIVSDKLGV